MQPDGLKGNEPEHTVALGSQTPDPASPQPTCRGPNAPVHLTPRKVWGDAWDDSATTWMKPPLWEDLT